MRNSKVPQVNAGSMADIAFLLLIFFLVSATIPNDKGFNRELPPECITRNCNDPITEVNLLRINLNANNETLIQDKIVLLNNIKDIVKNFVDNNGNRTCSYCQGKSVVDLSEHPTKAVISIKAHPKTSYSHFIKVQDELEKAYYELRSSYTENTLKKSIDELNEKDIKTLKEVYPFVLSEVNN